MAYEDPSEAMKAMRQSGNRSLGTIKVASRGRANQNEARKKLDAETFLVLSGQEYLASYPADGPYFRPAAPAAEGGDEYAASELLPANVENVVADLVDHFNGVGGQGFESLDMTVWNAVRLVAVVRKGPDGKPVATIFEPKPPADPQVPFFKTGE